MPNVQIKNTIFKLNFGDYLSFQSLIQETIKDWFKQVKISLNLKSYYLKGVTK